MGRFWMLYGPMGRFLDGVWSDGSLFGCYKCILPLVTVGFFKGEVFGVGIGYSTGEMLNRIFSLE